MPGGKAHGQPVCRVAGAGQLQRLRRIRVGLHPAWVGMQDAVASEQLPIDVQLSGTTGVGQ